MRTKLGLLPLLAVGACASPPKLAETEFAIEKPLPELAALYERQMRKCWRKEAAPLEPGITVSARPSDRKGAVFTATRHSLAGDPILGRPFKHEPFVHVELVPLSQSATLVKIKEGDHCLFLESCVEFKAKTQLQEWAQGNPGCRDSVSGAN